MFHVNHPVEWMTATVWLLKISWRENEKRPRYNNHHDCWILLPSAVLNWNFTAGRVKIQRNCLSNLTHTRTRNKCAHTTCTQRNTMHGHTKHTMHTQNKRTWAYTQHETHDAHKHMMLTHNNKHTMHTNTCTRHTLTKQINTCRTHKLNTRSTDTITHTHKWY